ncbi:hypothetical protein QR680_011796 [Steinernema hermaphroditum]|uniref:Uncharacterized protein n=1 Tax=Steinernema hermaphroditum TaxID=289476 RepID=A0AA39I297_9BILA|nr:hypothetical protein QR680_011796 [Steinernema hermaphroditum]
MSRTRWPTQRRQTSPETCPSNRWNGTRSRCTAAVLQAIHSIDRDPCREQWVPYTTTDGYTNCYRLTGDNRALVKGHLHEFATIGCKRFEDNEVKPLPAWIVDEHEEDFIYHTFASDPLVKGSEGENMVRILLGLLPKNRETWRKADDWHWIGSSNMVYSNFDLAEMHRSRSTRYAGGIFWHTNMTKPIGKWTGYYLSKAPLLCKYTVP